MKLIPMTDFVLEQGNQSNTVYQFSNKALSYAKFLKQPLELGMFIPCGEDGNILEEPKERDFYTPLEPTKEGKKRYNTNFEKFNQAKLDFEQAKEKVLVTGILILAVSHHISMGRDMEYLAALGELDLTESAIKQLGL